MGDLRQAKPDESEILPGGITPEQPPMDDAAGGPQADADETDGD